MPTLPLPFKAGLVCGLVTDFGQREHFHSKRDASRYFLAALRNPCHGLHVKKPRSAHWMMKHTSQKLTLPSWRSANLQNLTQLTSSWPWTPDWAPLKLVEDRASPALPSSNCWFSESWDKLTWMDHKPQNLGGVVFYLVKMIQVAHFRSVFVKYKAQNIGPLQSAVPLSPPNCRK